MVTVQDIKTALRINHAVLDQEIQATIVAAVLDLQSAGMPPGVDNALSDEAIRQYCKWRYDYMGKAAMYEHSYDRLKTVLALLPKEEVVGGG